MERLLTPVVKVRDRHINFRILKPALRAFAIGYLSSTSSRLISFLRRLHKTDLTFNQNLDELTEILTQHLRFDAFPSFCALLVGGSTISPVLLHRLCASVLRDGIVASPNFKRATRFISALLTSWFCFQIINKNHSRLQRGSGEVSEYDKRDTRRNKCEIEKQERRVPEFAGSSLDLSLFVFTRALDTVASMTWARWRAGRKARNKWTAVESAIPGFADAGVFAACCAVIMWAWIYTPDRLPKSYAKWISDAAKVDVRLLETLRRARRGELVYGKETGQAPFLQSMCKDYGMPLSWGDPAITIPLPCEVVHSGAGPSCERHAAMRFLQSFRFACETYFPLQFVVRIRSLKTMQAVVRTASGALRSSLFLATYVTIFYYCICLSRTRIGPRIFPRKTVTPMMWDAGLCVRAGCFFCGWSILIEKPSRRREISLFVAPRAAATVLPRVYDRQYLYRERIAFAVSSAVLFTCLKERPDMVRGVFGRIAARVLA